MGLAHQTQLKGAKLDKKLCLLLFMIYFRPRSNGPNRDHLAHPIKPIDKVRDNFTHHPSKKIHKKEKNP